MTRLLTCGWETGDVAELGGTSSINSGAVTVVAATPTPASGTACLKTALTGTTGTAYAVRSFTLPATKTDLWLRVRLYTSMAGADASMVTLHRVLRLLDSGGTMVAQVILDASTGILRAYRGGTATLGVNGAAGTLLGSSSVAVTGATWTLCEIHYVPTTGATGTFEIWINGTQALNVTATQTSSGLANVASFTLGLERNTASAGNAATYVAYDDLGANDTSGSLNTGRCGDYRIGFFPANGAGASSGWTPTSGANYTTVDDTGDLSAGTADYVAAASAALVDDYATADLPSGATSVPVVLALCYASNPDGGVGQVKVGLISGGTTSAGTAQSPGATYAYVRTQFETDPNTSAAWTVAGVNGAKLRIESA